MVAPRIHKVEDAMDVGTSWVYRFYYSFIYFCSNLLSWLPLASHNVKNGVIAPIVPNVELSLPLGVDRQMINKIENNAPQLVSNEYKQSEPQTFPNNELPSTSAVSHPRKKLGFVMGSGMLRMPPRR